MLFVLPLSTLAQEPAFMEAATHPGQGQFYSRLLFFGSEGDEYAAALKLSYGIIADLALQLDGEHRWLPDESDLTTSTVRLKYRILQKDLSPLNTWRASVLVGADFPEGGDPAPRLGAVTTAILGRHGLNGQIDWTGNQSEPDEFMLNTSYLYRIAPVEYSQTTKAAWYTMLELLNTFHDNSDRYIDIAPGLLYEARRWAAEISIRLPLDESGPRETDYTIEAGVRYLF